MRLQVSSLFLCLNARRMRFRANVRASVMRGSKIFRRSKRDGIRASVRAGLLRSQFRRKNTKRRRGKISNMI